jgi:uncharacterized protein with GYD domain
VERGTASASIAHAFGGRLAAFHMAFGKWDGVGIYEFPDNAHAAAFSIHLQGTAGFSAFETTPLLSVEESETAMRLAGETTPIVRPPNG